jgi:hypothetical protein
MLILTKDTVNFIFLFFYIFKLNFRIFGKLSIFIKKNKIIKN